MNFEPLKLKQSYIPHLKALMCGINAAEAQRCDCMFTFCYAYPKMGVLLHKMANASHSSSGTVPGCQWNNPNQTLFWYYALKFCKAPMKFDTKMALFDISVPSLPDLLTHVNREICQTLSIKLIWLSSWENTLQCRQKYFLNILANIVTKPSLGSNARMAIYKIENVPSWIKAQLAKSWCIGEKIYLTGSFPLASRYVPFHVLLLNRKVKAL